MGNLHQKEKDIQEGYVKLIIVPSEPHVRVIVTHTESRSDDMDTCLLRMRQQQDSQKLPRKGIRND
jgi:hypothetical protein